MGGATSAGGVAAVLGAGKNVEELAVEPGARGTRAVGAEEERRTRSVVLVAARDVLAQDGDGIDAIRGSGTEEADVGAVVEGVGFVVGEMVAGMVVVNEEGAAADEFPPVPEGRVVGGDEFADTMASKEGGGENGEE